MGSTIGGLFGKKQEQESSSRVFLPSYAKKPFKKALRLASDAVDNPFERFATEDRIVDFTDDELEAFNLTRDLIGQTAPQIEDSRAVTQQVIDQGLGGIDQSLIEDYMNPYTENVLDVRRDRALRDIDRGRRSIRDRQANIGAFGGSRSDVNEMLYLDESHRRLNEMEAEELRNAYGQGLAGAERGLQRAGQAAIDNANLAQLGRNIQAQDIGMLSGIGSQQRSLQQAGSDFDFSEFLRETRDPYTKAQFLAGIAQPMAATVAGSDSKTESQTTPGLGQVAMQIGAAAMGMPGLGGGGGGGLSSAIAGSVPSGSTFGSSGQFLSGNGINQAMGGGSGTFGVGSDPFNLMGGRTFYQGGLVAADNSYADGGLVQNAINSFKQGLESVQGGLNTIGESRLGRTVGRGLGALTDNLADIGISNLEPVERAINFVTMPEQQYLQDPTPVSDNIKEDKMLTDALKDLTSGDAERRNLETQQGVAEIALSGGDQKQGTKIPPKPEKKPLDLIKEATGQEKVPKSVEDLSKDIGEGKINTPKQYQKAVTNTRRRLAKEVGDKRSGWDRRWLAFASGIGKGRDLTESISLGIDGFLNQERQEEVDVLNKEGAIKQMAMEEAQLPLQDLRARTQQQNIETQQRAAETREALLPYEVRKIESEIQRNLAKSKPGSDVMDAYIKALDKHVGPASVLTDEDRIKVLQQILANRGMGQVNTQRSTEGFSHEIEE